jgi:DNA topoisomerase VI subunit B
VLPKAASALDMAARQRVISVSEFFLKNRHLLGFDTPAKALVIAVKEAVDNALDACEEAAILPEIRVEVGERYGECRVVVEDNGPGIVENQIARIFGKLLYGSKFHKLSQSRGQQGMGISAAGMYAQLTLAKPIRILSRTEGDALASELHVSIDTIKNRPDIHRKKRVQWDRPHGTRVEMEMEGHDQKGPRSVEVYLKQTAIANPHVTLVYRNPAGTEIRFERNVQTLLPLPREIKPHPLGVELGRLIHMLSSTTRRTLLQFLVDEFSGVGRTTALKMIAETRGRVSRRSYPKHIAHVQATALHRAMQKVRVVAPRTDCLVPIGEENLLNGLRKELDADFLTAATRPATAYRGNPFQVEVAIACSRPDETDIELDQSGHMHRKRAQGDFASRHLLAHRNEPVHVLRFANRVPLLYQQSSCAITAAVLATNWRNYGLNQPKGGLPVAPLAIMVHVASVWVPYTSESKEAIEPYPEILREIRLGLQQCGRALAHYLRRDKRLHQEYDRRTYIEKFLPHIGIALQDILDLDDDERDGAVKKLEDALHRSRRF